jgi:hypothetical protein
MPVGVDASTNNVSVLLPIYFDVSGINSELFGQLVDVSGTVMRVRDKLPVSSLYDASGALISFRQDSIETQFEIDISNVYARRLARDISGSLHIAEGEHYDITKRGVDHIDASLVFVAADVTDAFKKYNSIQDFVVSYFANKILGHPGALSAISNDSSIREMVSNMFAQSVIEYKLSSSTKTEGSMTDNDAKGIVQQMMNQDLARFDVVDKRADGYTPLPFAPGDLVYIQVRMSNNSYTLHNTLANPSSLSFGTLTPANASAGEVANDIPDTEDQYLLEFMIGTDNSPRTDY